MKKQNNSRLATVPRDPNDPDWIAPPSPDAPSAILALPLPDGWRNGLPPLFVECDDVFAATGSPGFASRLVAVVGTIGKPIEGMASWLFDFGVGVRRLGTFVDTLIQRAVARTINSNSPDRGKSED